MNLDIKNYKEIFFERLPQGLDVPVGETWVSTLWETVEDRLDVFYYKGNAYGVSIKAGFLHDMGSIPKPGRIFFDKSGIAAPIYVIHDFLYRTEGGKRISKKNNGALLKLDHSLLPYDTITCTRRTADNILRAGYNYLSKYDYRSRFIWAACHFFGRKHWGGPVPSLKK